MGIDTNSNDPDHRDVSRLIEIRGESGETEVISNPPRSMPRDDFGALLTHLDGVFRPLMDAARANQPPSTKGCAGVAVGSAPANPSGPSTEDIAERDLYLAKRQQAPAKTEVPDPHTPAGIGAGGMPSPRRGIGAPVFVGIDAEWDPHANGRNKLLSVQLYLVGPTGERLSKFIEVRNGEDRQARPSLAETLEELLDEAESYCIFDEWPSEVILCGFFNRVDIPIFRDAGSFIRQLQGISGSLASAGQPAKLALALGEERVVRLKARHAFIVGGSFDPRILPIRLIDAKLLAPPGASLAMVGDWIGIPKIKLPPGFKKSKISRFASERPESFREYGLVDAQIAVMYVLWVLWFCDRHLGLKGLSATASGIGMRLAQLCMRRDGVHPDVALNFRQANRWYWPQAKGKPLSFKSREPTPIRRWFENFLADAYQGGRNECYWFGPTPVKDESTRLYDHDLAGCYVVSLAGLMVLDYERIEIVRDRARYVGHVAGFAQIRFKFPPGTEYPCIPVIVGNYGLWFPLSGVGIATAPEIELAMEMGAEIEILFGVIIPWMERGEVFRRSRKMLRRGATQKGKVSQQLVWEGDTLVPIKEMSFPPESHGDTGYRGFESFAIYTRTERLRYRKKTLPNEFMKLLGNSAYGKTGQGFNDKRIFSPREMRSEKVGQSAISEAAVAALTSGFARAVLGEILWKLPPGTLAVSATTDGVLVQQEQLDLTGTMCRRFQNLVDRVAPGTGMTELKHLIGQAVAGKTRLQLTGKLIDGQEPVVAKGGVKVLLDAADGDEAKEKELMLPVNQNRFVLDLFVNRFPGQKIKRPSSMSSRDQLLNDWDFQVLDKDMRVSMEFDFKRRPVNPQMIEIDSHGVSHLAFSTVPWETAEEGELVRVLFDQWRRGDDKGKPGHCLKSLDDWDDWQRFQQLYVGNRQRRQAYQARLELAEGAPPLLGASLAAQDVAGNLPAVGEPPRKPASRCATGMLYATQKGGYVGIAIRCFLAAYVQRAWGLDGERLSQSKLAAWMTAIGYPIKTHDVKNAGRTVLHEHAVPCSPEVLAFFQVMKARFPNLEVARFLVPPG